MEIELDREEQEVRVSARGSRGERVAPAPLAPFNMGRLTGFSSGVRRAVVKGAPLADRVLADARALHEALFRGPIRDLHTRLLEAARSGGRDAPVLLRLMTHDLDLQRIPWEAVCRPDAASEFLGCSAHGSLARGVNSTEPYDLREVRGAVRLLAISALGDVDKLAALRSALAEPIATGAIEWLEPIAGDDARTPRLFERLRRSEQPHVLHWIGHGGADPSGGARLMLPEDERGEPRWVLAETLAQELRQHLSAALRLVVLEACSGARPGSFASSAELLARSGADAVVAHLWPVKAEVSRALAADFYRALTEPVDGAGDVAASLQAARRVMIDRGAEAFSPVLYLRGADARLFDFSRRRLRPPVPRDSIDARPLDPALSTLLAAPFSLVLGDGADTAPAARALEDDLRELLRGHPEPALASMGLGALAQRVSLRAGKGKVNRLFQKVMGTSIDLPIPAHIRALARFLRPGAHTTLLWLPMLEAAIAEQQPNRTIYVIQPAPPGSGERRLIMVRRAGAREWVDDDAPDEPDFDEDYVLLRLYGGYSAEAQPVLSEPQLTEDDHIRGLIELRELFPIDWEGAFMGHVRMRPLLCVGVSILEWRHRMLVSWLLDQRPPSRVSVAITPPERDEADIWDGGAGGLFGRGSVRAITMSATELGALLLEVDDGGA
ncbi:MAG: CHAT domain-containing protein [Nannocystaceae bacterium]